MRRMCVLHQEWMNERDDFEQENRAKIPIRKEFGVSSQEKKIFIPIQTFFDSISIYNNNVADWNRWRWTCDVNNMTRWRGRRNWWIRCHPPIRLHVAPLKSKHTPPQSQHISFEILSLLLITPHYKLLGVLLFHLFVIS